MKIPALLLALFALSPLAVHAGSIEDLTVKDIDGKQTPLAAYKGKVLLVVNVASKCGNTPQYDALEAAYTKYRSQGFVILGFPCNQFKSQEPGTDEQIKQFCTETYHVNFPLFDKLDVNGPDRSPVYVDLAGSESPFPGDIAWNFTKFLVGRDGKILRRFEPKTKPDAPEVVQAIEGALASK